MPIRWLRDNGLFPFQHGLGANRKAKRIKSLLEHKWRTVAPANAAAAAPDAPSLEGDPDGRRVRNTGAADPIAVVVTDTLAPVVTTPYTRRSAARPPSVLVMRARRYINRTKVISVPTSAAAPTGKPE